MKMAQYEMVPEFYSVMEQPPYSMYFIRECPKARQCWVKVSELSQVEKQMDSVSVP